MSSELMVSPWVLVGFLAVVAAVVAVDLGVFQRRPHEVSLREAGIWSAVWVALACGFGAWVWVEHGARNGMEFFTGYLIEKGLSVDNLFVILTIFRAFAVPRELRHRVLLWGVLGAVVMRGLFIAAGAVLVQRFDWVLYVFGAILIVTAIRMLFQEEGRTDPSQSRTLRLLQRHLPVTADYEGKRFFVRREGRRVATPLLLALVAVELSDLIFAVDSIPAIFGVTRDFFIVFTSNILAILGLRAMFFLLEGVLDRFRYLDYGLAAVLAGVGVKLLLEDVVHIPVTVSLGAVVGILALSLALSWLLAPGGRRASGA